jgi:hypothetical protein
VLKSKCTQTNHKIKQLQCTTTRKARIVLPPTSHSCTAKRHAISIWHGPKACAKRTGATTSVQASDMSASPELGEACELARATRERQARPLSARIRTKAHGENIASHCKGRPDCAHLRKSFVQPAHVRSGSGSSFGFLLCLHSFKSINSRLHQYSKVKFTISGRA